MAKWKHDTGNRLSPRSFLVPVMWIAALVASYLVLADWQNLPNLVSSALAAI